MKTPSDVARDLFWEAHPVTSQIFDHTPESCGEGEGYASVACSDPACKWQVFIEIVGAS